LHVSNKYTASITAGRLVPLDEAGDDFGPVSTR
jgi:hypothetical protein